MGCILRAMDEQQTKLNSMSTCKGPYNVPQTSCVTAEPTRATGKAVWFLTFCPQFHKE